MSSGKLVAIAAPSGSGKTTIAREILTRNPSLSFSVSATTRSKRSGEVEGRDYFFLTAEEFKKKIDAGEFVEWEQVYGHYYGTMKREVDRALQSGKNLLFDVDVNGALSIRRQYPDTLLIFLLPPSMEALQQRLKGRRTEDPSTIARRLERVPMELEKGMQFDHQIVNDELSRAIEEVQRIVHAHIHT